MPPTSKASCKKSSFHPSEAPPATDRVNKKVARPASNGRSHPASSRKLLLKVDDVVARCTRSQTALRSKENQQLTVIKEVDGKPKIGTGFVKCLDTVDQGSFSGIRLSQECQPRKGTRKKASSESSKGRKKQKHSSRRANGKPKESLAGDEIEEKRPAASCSWLSATFHPTDTTECTREVFVAPQVGLSADAKQAELSKHQAIKTRISLMRQEVLSERDMIGKLRDKLARNKDTARASLSYRQFRIQKELFKLRERVELENKRRLKAEECRIQRQLEAGRRKADSDRLSMKMELAKEWKDRYQRRKQDVRQAKRALRKQGRNHEMEKREVLQRLQKSWTHQRDRVQAMRDRIETELVVGGRQWDGECWTGTAGKHKYSLRRAPREKTHIYCRAWKMTNKKEPVLKPQDEGPKSGGTIYKETKWKMLNEMYQVLDNELRCSICSELIISAVVLNCCHTFCSYCITQWKRRTDWCPICRTCITCTNPISQLDSFITKSARSAGRDVEKKRSETVKDRQELERELKEGGRSWGNSVSHSLQDLDDEDDDFNDSLDSDDSDIADFFDILEDRVGSSMFRRIFAPDFDDEWAEEEQDSLFDLEDEDLLLSSDDSLGFDHHFDDEAEEDEDDSDEMDHW